MRRDCIYDSVQTSTRIFYYRQMWFAILRDTLVLVLRSDLHNLYRNSQRDTEQNVPYDESLTILWCHNFDVYRTDFPKGAVKRTSIYFGFQQ